MKKNTIWIVGANGRLGSVLVEFLSKNRMNKIFTTDLEVDISDKEVVDQYIDIYRPTIVINCASISDVEYCENHMVEAFRVNAIGARNLASASRKVNAKMIQISTDDIFMGNNDKTLTEFDTPTPVSVYGKSKLAGENYVKELNQKHLIIRSSWVYGEDKKDYLGKVLEHGKSATPFEAGLDKISTPTSSYELAKFIESMIEHNEYGIYHASCEGACSRYEFAKAALRLAGYDHSIVKGTFVQRDGNNLNTVLENLMMKITGIYEMPEWEKALEDHFDRIKGV